MLYIHYRVKFRAFGITFGTTEGWKNIDSVVPFILRSIQGVVKGKEFQNIVDAFDVPGISGAYLKFQPVALMDDRGVFLELTPKSSA